MTMQLRFMLLLFVWLSTIFVSCTRSLDYEKMYDQLRTGMAQSQAEKMMGTPAHKRESITIAGATLERLTWCHRNEYYAANFVLGHLVSTDKGNK